MPCVCGQKVDRGLPKIRCDNCNEYFHLSCVKLSQDDVDFLQKTNHSFYCEICTKRRRNSFRSLSPSLVPTKSVTDSVNSLAAAVNQPKQQSQNANSTSVLPRSENVKHKQQSQSLNMMSAIQKQNFDHPKATVLESMLKSVLDEVVGLKAENLRMFSLLQTLYDDKNILLKKVDDLQAELGTLMSIIRKKNCTLAVDAADIENIPPAASVISTVAGTIAADAAAAVDNILSTATSTSNAALPTTNMLYSDVVGKITAANTNAETVTVMAPALNRSQPTSSIASKAQLPAVGVSAKNMNTVQQNKLPKRRILVVGNNNNNDNVELDVVIKKKWVHVSAFKPTVTADSIIAYVSKNSGVDSKHLACFKLIKKGSSLDNIRSVNFKFGVLPSSYEKIMNPNVWPSGISIRPFQIFQREGTTEPTK
ncbi:PREDICTED: uncharacterized protein LOC108368347 isoform X2 [Rhagoletis zephyria]|uniref:uncharacterized protein LOC108368347 isoform X1 n=1 Tax=Rhagoletis zephyria TaxID=28612 RepID=UPI000811A7AF|nr:PREDICTED: uncharacterized protein LOC108368347 isoform X1 [Rhagoletis zephyria]XP_017478688.1 PREDICTED: uncharacterized protein LOC108368347 isoform X2 [Rhagoletis zephyria]